MCVHVLVSLPLVHHFHQEHHNSKILILANAVLAQLHVHQQQQLTQLPAHVHAQQMRHNVLLVKLTIQLLANAYVLLNLYHVHLVRLSTQPIASVNAIHQLNVQRQLYQFLTNSLANVNKLVRYKLHNVLLL